MCCQKQNQRHVAADAAVCVVNVIPRVRDRLDLRPRGKVGGAASSSSLASQMMLIKAASLLWVTFMAKETDRDLTRRPAMKLFLR